MIVVRDAYNIGLVYCMLVIMVFYLSLLSS